MDGRDETARELLRQLATGLGAYRLFPDDPDQPAFVAAVGRIRGAAERLLAGGPPTLEVVAEQFRLPDGTHVSDGTLQRLARACFDRRVEHLRVRAVPAPHELATLFGALSRPVGEVAEAGGVPALLAGAGVVSIELGEVQPDVADHPAPSVDLTDEQLEIWQLVRDPDRHAANLLVGRVSGDPAEEAARLYRRFAGAAAILPERFGRGPEFFAALMETLTQLPTTVAHELAALVITRAGDDQFAEDWLRHLTDSEVAGTAAALAAAGGPDAVEVARRVVELTGRHPSVIELTAEVAASPAGARDGAPTPPAGPETGDNDEIVRDTASRILADDNARPDDAVAAELRRQYPTGDAARVHDALLSFLDYILVEHDLDRLGEVLEVWVDHVREALGASDHHPDPAVLLETVETAYSRSESDPDRQRVLEAVRDRIVTPELVTELLAATASERGPGEVAERLRPFRPGAIHAVFAALAEEERRSTRARLVALAAELAGPEGSEEVASYLRDPAWYVARNAATVLARIGDPEAWHRLVPFAEHPEPRVRGEVARALVVAAGSRAVPHLRRLAADDDDRVRQTALAGLRRMDAAAAGEALLDAARGAPDHPGARQALDVAAERRDGAALLRQAAERGSGLARSLRRHARRRLRELEARS